MCDSERCARMESTVDTVKLQEIVSKIVSTVEHSLSFESVLQHAQWGKEAMRYLQGLGQAPSMRTLTPLKEQDFVQSITLLFNQRSGRFVVEALEAAYAAVSTHVTAADFVQRLLGVSQNEWVHLDLMNAGLAS